MDFDDHDDQEEEIGIPVGSSYESPPGNSSRGRPSGGALGKIGGGGGEGAAASAAIVAGSGGGWKPTGGGGGGRYRECLKNHAVGIGGHAVDGCGEFMAAGEEGTLDALKCAACNCHRNFHRKETEGGGSGGVGGMMGMEGPGGFHHHFSPYYRIPAGYLQHHHTAAHIRPSPLPLALPSTSGGGGTHSRDDQEDMSNPMIAGSGGGGASSGGREGKKRFRTKFTQEQKDKMLAFAEKLGWRIQKHDEAAVQQFCAESNVKRHVLKVWMHNNKHTLGKKP